MGRDGIHIEDFDAARVTFLNNVTDDNARDGIRLERFKDSAGTGLAMDIINPTANSNDQNGISLVDIAGNFRFLNSNITNNLSHGISLVNVTNPGATDEVFVGTSGGGISLFEGNGVGTGAGIFNDLNVAGTERLTITNTAILNGGSGVISNATGAGANLTTSIMDMVSNNPLGRNGISGNAADGILASAADGATHNLIVRNNIAAPLQIANNGGNGIALNSSGAGPVSLIQAEIDNVAMSNIGTAGIVANVIEDGSAIVRASNSSMTGIANDGVLVNANNDNSAAVNQFAFENLTLTNIGGDGFDINVLDQTNVDFVLTNSVVTNAAAAPLGDQAVELSVNGDAAAVIDSRLRVAISGNTFNSFDGGGIQILSTGDARVLANIDGNTITGNGLSTITGQPTVPFGDGIEVIAAGDSTISARIRNNNITGNGEQGIDLRTAGMGTLNAFVTGNLVTGNDVGEDPATAAIEAGNADMTAANAFGGTMCVAMSNNFFNLPAFFTNANGSGAFTVERDGLTNGPNLILVGGDAAFTIGTFSTICEPTIAAEDLAFGGSGFPPTP